jgi:Skp family chaperone for outer membrane proteins
MLRILATIVLPLLLPTALYLLWIQMAERRGGGRPVRWAALPWVWLAGTGTLLLIVVLFVINVGFGSSQPLGVTASAQTPAAPAATPAASPPPPAASPQPLNVMVVDIQTLLRKSKAAGMVRQQLEQKRAEYAKEMSTQNEALRHESEALQQQASSLSPDALNQKKQDFQQKRSEFDKNVRSKRQALERSEAEASEKIQTVIRDIVTEMATEKNVNLVFQSTQLVIVRPSFNVTDTVLQKLDERLPSLSVNIVEEPAANTPALAAQLAVPPKKKK